MLPDEPDFEALIREYFNKNFEALMTEGGHFLSPAAKEMALQQVLVYWRKLRDIAERVTDTEVHLNLPEQETPRGRKFGIEGVVDIIREHGRTIMYDIKAHDTGSVRANLPEYEKQLNVYAHIWQQLRSQQLDETAIITTVFPDAVREALNVGDEAELRLQLGCWNPIVPIPFDPRHVEQTIREFGRVVDAIEDGEFAPASVDRLQSRAAGRSEHFATRVCRNCDARYSCDSYRTYALSGRSAAERALRPYLADLRSETEREDWIMAALAATPPITTFEEATE